MGARMTTPYTITQRAEFGTHYVVHTIRLADGRKVAEQIGPYSEREAAERVAAFLRPAPIIKARDFEWGRSMSKPGPKPKRPAPEPEDFE